jgi:hypothetical protein
VTDDPSTEARRGRRALSPAERIVGAGVIAVGVSMLFPWYGLVFRGGLSVTGLDSFGFAHAALLITAGAAAFLVARNAAGHSLPRPLRTAELVIAAGVWAAALTAYLIADRPDQLAGATEVQIRYGVFVALAGSLAIAVGGMRMRSERK